jgi:HAE1 family hydrophobic/amphiphilic exporter-1
MPFDIFQKKDAPPVIERPGFNYSIAKFFLEKSRLTILALLLLLLVGLVSTFSLRTTGFPNITINDVFIQTSYPGASAQTVAQQVTIPIEGKVKDIDGVDTYSSQSSNSFSTITLTLQAGANADTVSSKVTTALQGLSLPAGAKTPLASTLNFGGPDFRISIAGTNLAQVYAVETKFKQDLAQNANTGTVTAVDELSPQVTVTVDPTKLAAAHLTESQVITALKAFGVVQPVGSDLTINGTSQSLSTTLSGTTINDLKLLPLTPAPAPTTVASVPPQGVAVATPAPIPSTVALGSVAAITYDYTFATQPVPVLGYNNASDHGTLPAVTLLITAAKGVDVGTYTKQVRTLMSGYSNAHYVRGDPVLGNDGVQIVEQFSSDDSNQKQVSQVVQGLIGGRLPIANKSESELGWLLGGIQLVFLVMMALVSWRAALVSALAIPLSLLFATTYLNLTGNTLNTIVLFALVLAIGLVVDPALVVLEAVQRKIDAGARGNAAVLEAVKDVGGGLFIATLNNIIVFLPFGLVSGIVGQIFANIPAAIVPALVGSYIVPLIFLAWLGGLILKPGKRTSHDEEENLWPFARWLVRFNQGVLDGSVIRRFVLIFIAGVLPLAMIGFYFGTGRITFTEFSGSNTGTFVDVTGTFKTDLSKQERQSTTEAILNQVSQKSHLGSIYPIGAGFDYEAYVKNGDSYSANSLQNDISAVLNQYTSRFTNATASVLSTGPPSSQYQVQIAVASNDPARLEAAAKAVGVEIQTACLEKKSASLGGSCSGVSLVQKVDDGYTGNDNQTLQVTLDRAKLAAYGLDAQGAEVTQTLQALFPTSDPTAAGSLTVDGNQVNIYLASDVTAPSSVAAIEATPLVSPTGAKLTLNEVATVTQTTGATTITRDKGQTETIVQAALVSGHDDQGTATKLTNAIVKYYNDNNAANTTALGLASGAISSYSEGGAANFASSFIQLIEVLGLAVFATYFVLVVFFDSFLQPLVILFTIPLTFIGILPALAYIGSKQFGFFEIIGMIILVGLVDNVAIFLIDAARHRIREGMDPKTAIAHASGIRLRPVILTKAVALASLAPLAVLAPFYRSISLVIMFGLLTSGLTSLFTTPILFIFFRWLSERYMKFNGWNKFFFLFLSVPYLLVMAAQHKNEGKYRIVTL